MNNVKRFDFTLTEHKNYQTYGSYVLAEDYDKLVEQVEKLTKALERVADLSMQDTYINIIARRSLEETC